MNRMERFHALIPAARRESPPKVDVAAGVIGRIREGQPTGDAPLAIIAAVSSVAAAVVGFVAVQMWANWEDPVVALLATADVVLR